MQMTPTIAVHMSAAIGALALGPFALWARLGRTLLPNRFLGQLIWGQWLGLV